MARVTFGQLPSESLSAMTNAVSINHSAIVAFEDFARMTGDAVRSGPAQAETVATLLSPR